MTIENSKTSTYAVYRHEGQYIYFGEYPQSVKKVDVTIQENSSDENGYFRGSDNHLYAKVTANPRDVGATFASGEPIIRGEEYYFKVEPIRWKILSQRDGELLLLCDLILTGRRFDASDNCYKTSDVRAFLNGEFYSSAFYETEREQILLSSTSNGAQSTKSESNPYICEDTDDHIFLLSREEISNDVYNFRPEEAGDLTRQLKTSDYARALGVSTSTTPAHCGNGTWRLRTPDATAKHATCAIHSSGSLCTLYVDAIEGIAPALRLRLNKEDRSTYFFTRTYFGEFDDLTPVKEKKADKKRLGLIGIISVAVIALLLLILFPEACRGKHEYIYMGEYPQSVKEEGVTVDESIVDSRGYFLGSDGAYYAKLVAKPVNNDYTFTNGTAITYGETYYFKVEPIRFRVLKKKDGTALLLCDSIIDHQMFDDNADKYHVSNDYESSTIRAWLNGSFLDKAFSDASKDVILPSVLKLDQNTTVEDKIFLLSLKEVKKGAYGFALNPERDDKARRLKVSDYVRALGGWMNTEEALLGDGTWWLRTPWDRNDCDALRVLGGKVGASVFARNREGVVPAMLINLDALSQ